MKSHASMLGTFLYIVHRLHIPWYKSALSEILMGSWRHCTKFFYQKSFVFCWKSIFLVRPFGPKHLSMEILNPNFCLWTSSLLHPELCLSSKSFSTNRVVNFCSRLYIQIFLTHGDVHKPCVHGRGSGRVLFS